MAGLHPQGSPTGSRTLGQRLASPLTPGEVKDVTKASGVTRGWNKVLHPHLLLL